ncbi:LysR family transcriptional regulator [Corticibacter populi]|uniref:LysR family transcriptional regulator n=1 Tax=Corticibacter populi TaxID=1550736 RepID=A0A3M6QU96_9BURK|nr:LysR family transcriptional regulator [Corticibacter populi]RMX06605.1 LysR family transcriptional regulator [Corticibacter populi]RZS31825.1 LysR family transcriptional regulator [Corticibacter populi]
MDFKRISWDDLRVFLEVGRNRTLSAAARQLGLDDSTVSRRIAQLEYRLGEALLERDHQGARPTARGVQLLEHVREMERGMLALAEDMEDPALPTGKVRLASMEGISTLYLSGQFTELRRRHPQLLIELVTSSNMVHVNRREADLLITFFPLEARGLEVMPVGEFRLHLYAAPAYLAQKGTPRSLEALSSHAFVSYIDDLVQLDTVRWLQETIAEPQVVFQSTSMLSQMFAAASGAGLVMLPEFARAEQLYGLVRVLEQEIQTKRTLWLSVHRDLQYMRRVKTVIGFLREIFNRDYPCPPGVLPMD